MTALPHGMRQDGPDKLKGIEVMAVILPKGGKTFRYDFTVDGKPHKGSTGIKARGVPGSREFEASKAEAKRYVENLKTEKLAAAAKALILASARQTLGIIDSNGNTVIPTFLMAVDAYWKNQGEKAANAQDDEKYLFWLTDVIGADTLVTDIRNRTVEMVVNQRASMPKLSKPRRDKKTRKMVPGQPQVFDFETEKLRPFVPGKDDPRHIVKLAPSTVNRTSIDVLKRVILYARDTLEVPGMPPIKWKDYRRREAEARSRTLSHTEEMRIEKHLREGYGAAFKFAIKAGFRLSNFTEAFTWRQINFDTRTITIIQKGGREHTIIMTDEMEAILREQIGRDPKYVFMFRFKGRGSNPRPWRNPTNGEIYVPGKLYPVSYWGFDSWFDDVKEATGIVGLRNHDLRRTAASRVVRAIGDRKAAQHLLGHGSEKMLSEVYDQIEKEEAFAALNEADRRIAARRAQWDR
ncbi:tyrosine-type recombinase/integrase [Microvirga alba]|uniref:Tyrosine-type recombinase/integrase n=1 Tax=Microvirga alba TaxID=2791025 RepID=A0A931BNU3_9HYPH|nr:tyrosine-type recombinase/integrase [Microvirga alba]MBF9234627.1 tyrosine-type recombinase/integrase [Microvirga alba]